MAQEKNELTGAAEPWEEHASKKLIARDLDEAAFAFYFSEEHVDWIAHCVGVLPYLRARESGRLIKVSPDGTDFNDPFYDQDKVYEDVCGRLVNCVPINLQLALGILRIPYDKSEDAADREYAGLSLRCERPGLVQPEGF